MNRVLRKTVLGLNNHGFLRWMPDRQNIKLIYRAQLGKKLDLDDPKTFNEKLQWIKLNDRNPEYADMVDKFNVRAYIAEKIGEEYLIPLLGCWENASEIDFDLLPDQFVLKCTHDSGSVRICRNKQNFAKEEAAAFLNNRLKKGTFYYGREWPYSLVKPKIIAEELLFDEETDDLRDYKVHCFNGEPKVILVCSERHTRGGLKEDWFTEKWEHLPVHRPTHGNLGKDIPCPKQLSDMLQLARKLSEGLTFSRIDFYIVNGRIYFSEITFFPASGYTAFVPEEYDRIFGDLIHLPY